MANPAKLAVKLSEAVAPRQIFWAVPAMVGVGAGAKEIRSGGLFAFRGDMETKEGFFHYFDKPRFGSPTLKTVSADEIRGFDDVVLRVGDPIGDLQAFALVGADGEPVWWVKADEHEPQQREFLVEKLIEFRTPDLRGEDG